MSTAAIPVFSARPLPGPAVTASTRRAAIEELRAAGWPTRSRESWRYTDLEPLAAANFEFAPTPAASSEIDAVRRLLAAPVFGIPGRQLVLLDGRRVPGLCAPRLDGVEVHALEQRWSEFEAQFPSRPSAARYPLAALNTAYMEHGVWLRVAAGTDTGTPIHIVVVSSTQARVAAQPRIVIELENGAKASVIQHFVDCDDAASGWTNSVTQLRLAESSRLVLYRLQQHAPTQSHTSLLTAELAARACLEAGYFDVGGKLVRNDIAIDLGGAGAQTELLGLFLAGGGQHVDDHTTIEHTAPETLSREAVRGIIGERGRGVFNGRVVVKPGCQRIDAQQSNDNLLLGDNAEIDTKPELEIYANDVKCGHGSTVGEIDPEQLLYLRTRGIDASHARRMLTDAFATAIIERVRDEEFRDRLLECVSVRLASLTGS